jgi:cystathionine beta-lyase/cystathionine gamma-synthase
MDYSDMGFSTRAIHAGQEPDPTTGAIMTPLFYLLPTCSLHLGSIRGMSTVELPTRLGKLMRIAWPALRTANMGFGFASGCAASTTFCIY